MSKIVEKVDIADDLHIYKQANSKRWYARFKLSGEWYSKATKEKDLTKATVKAVQLQTEYRIMLSNNIPVHSTRKSKKYTFNAIADLAIERLEDALQNGNGKVVFSNYISALKNYHIPFFKGMHIRDVVAAQALLDFDAYRIEQFKRVPAKSTILTHNAAMQRVLDEAVIQKYITASELPVLKNTGETGKRRAAFDKSEYKQILDKAKDWIDKGQLKSSQPIRERLYYYIQIAALTGMRIGTEMDNLTWDDVQFKDKNNKPYLTFTVRKGKTTKYTGTRQIVAKKELVSVIEKMLLELRKGKDWKQSDKIFGNTSRFGTNFKKLLEKLNLKSNATGERTLYSLRHSYITWALEKGTALRTIADQCGTSEQMIEQHYKHTNPMMHAEELS